MVVVALVWLRPDPVKTPMDGVSTLTIVADTWTDPDQPDEAFGTAQSLTSGSGVGGNVDLYLSVDGTALPPGLSTSRVTVAFTLIDPPADDVTLTMYRLDPSPLWTETSLTGRTSLSCGERHGARVSEPVEVAAGTDEPFEVTTAVERALPVNSVTTFCVTGDATSTGTTVDVASREAPSGAPQASVEWTASSTPVANDDRQVVPDATSSFIDVLANDSSPDPLQIASIITEPRHGTATTVDGLDGTSVVEYRPDDGFCGRDELSYGLAGDDAADSAEARVLLTVACDQDPPNPTDDAASFSGDDGVVVDVLRNDRRSDYLALLAIVPPRNGEVSLTDEGFVQYQPAPGHLGDDEFSYTVTDATGLRSTASVTVQRDCVVSAELVPSCGAWWGAAQMPGGAQSLESLEATLRTPLPIGHLYLADGAIPSDEDIAYATRPGTAGALYLNVKPGSLATGEPTWAEVAQGGADDYLDSVAARLAAIDRPVFVTLHHEPEDEVDQTAGSGRTTDDYVAMFRHAAERIEAAAPEAEIVWVWNVMGYPKWEPLWSDLYPGDDYVDWIAYDPYLQEPAGCDISCVVNRTYAEYPEWDGFYDWATERFPDTPLMLGEWGVRESAQDGQAKAELFASAPEVLARDFPALRALIYFNDDKSPDDPTSTRLETSPKALDAFRDMTSQPYFANAALPAPS
jgi:hypothetical protein